ncbi:MULTISPECIES: hypothetical protein [unclassified Schlesneria]|uniref:hypothetical protein n=1 Tax=Schlesneria TaxID=656899 RepID=UPI002F128B4A
MDAFFRGLLLIGALASVGATYRTPNFSVDAPTPDFAKQVGDAAEVYRRELAIEWTGKPLPGNWKHPCPISVKVGSMGAGGATTFNFQGGEVYGWKMEVQGSEQRILDSVLPHEINHTIFASHFRRPLPRWADEGAASLIEHDSERNRLRDIHSRVMGTRRKIPLRTLLDIKNYPEDKQDVLTLYAEGHSLADFLIQHADKPQYLRLMALAHERGWEVALNQLYGFQSIESLEREWDDWVLAGSAKLPAGTQIATRDRNRNDGPLIRGQSPDNEPRLGDPEEIHPFSLDAERDLEIAQVPTRRSRDGMQEPLFTVRAVNSAAAKVSQNRKVQQRDDEDR